MRTSFHHQPEAQHPSAIHKYAGRLPHLMTHTGHHACVLAARGGASRPLPERKQERPRLGIAFGLRTGHMRQIFIDGGQFVVIHSSNRTPRHLLADFMAVGIDAGAHRGDELGKLPVLDEI